MSLVRFALRNLTTWHPRTFGALAGITIAVASFVALVSLARGVEETLASSVTTRGTDAVVTEAGALDLISSIVPDRLAGEIAGLPGVAETAPELTRLTSLEDGRSVVVVSWPVGSFPWRSLEVVAGRLPDQGEPRVVAVGEGLADRAGFAVGDTLTVFHDDFQITGVVTGPSVLARTLVYAPLPDVQELTFREGQATSINLDLEPGDPGGTVAALRKAHPDMTVEETEQMAENYLFGRIANVLALTISTVAMISAVLVIFTTMSTAVNARRGEIAILSAIGWPRWRVVWALLIEGAVLASVSGLIGIAAGVTIAKLVAAQPEIEGFVAPVFSMGLLVQAFLLSLAVGWIGTIVPALRATARAPAEILRSR